MPSEIVIIVIELMFLSVNTFLALLRAHFRAKIYTQSALLEASNELHELQINNRFKDFTYF